MYMPLWRAQRGLTLQTNTGDIAEELRRRAAEPPTPAVKGPAALGVLSLSFLRYPPYLKNPQDVVSVDVLEPLYQRTSLSHARRKRLGNGSCIFLASQVGWVRRGARQAGVTRRQFNTGALGPSTVSDEYEYAPPPPSRGTAQFRRHEIPESGIGDRKSGIRKRFRFVLLFRNTKETRNGNPGFPNPDGPIKPPVQNGGTFGR